MSKKRSAGLAAGSRRAGSRAAAHRPAAGAKPNPAPEAAAGQKSLIQPMLLGDNAVN